MLPFGYDRNLTKTLAPTSGRQEEKMNKEQVKGWSNLVMTLVVAVVAVFFTAVIAVAVVILTQHVSDAVGRPITKEEPLSYEVGTIASVISVGEDPDGTFKVRISRGGADLQTLTRREVENWREFRPGDKIICANGRIWVKISAIVDVVDVTKDVLGQFNGFHKGDRIAIIVGHNPVLVHYWDPTKDSKR